MTGRRERQESGGFAIRLREVVQGYGSASALAKAISRSEGAVRKWLRGESEPNVTDLRALSEETRTSLEWLVAGRGPRQAAALDVRETTPSYKSTSYQTVDYALLEGVMAAVDAELQSSGRVLSPTKRSVLVVTLYDLCHERKEVDKEAVARLVRLTE